MVLIVDDKPENLFSLKTVLEQHGFAADTALSGEEALKKVLRHEYALIILDVQMPGMDGFEVAEAITGLNKTKDIPIIFLSAVSTHKRFVTKGFETGAIDYLTKPVDTDILVLKVRNFYQLYEKTQALKKAEKELTETVSQLHITLEALPQLAFTTDRTGAIEYTNIQWLEYADSKEVFPKAAAEGESIKDTWLKAIATCKPVERELQLIRRSDGAPQFHLLKATPISLNGGIIRWVGTLTNINEQKQLNETLERKVTERTAELSELNRQLQISNDDLQQFTSVASHDLKEPLRKVQFFGNLLRDTVTLDEKPAVYLEKMLQSSARMSKLITDLLTFASLSQANHFRPCNINTILSEILIDLELSIHEKAASINIGTIPEIEVVPDLVRQMFQNIISNALKFSKRDVPPHITISGELTGGPGDEQCLISITDNGIGFEEEYAERIFTIFQRLNARTEYECTGIGLAIAKKIVEKHHGTITARSAPDQGASFIITLPVKQPTVQPH